MKNTRKLQLHLQNPRHRQCAIDFHHTDNCQTEIAATHLKTSRERNRELRWRATDRDRAAVRGGHQGMAHLQPRFLSPQQKQKQKLQQQQPMTMPCSISRTHNIGNHNRKSPNIGIHNIGSPNICTHSICAHDIGSPNICTHRICTHDIGRPNRRSPNICAHSICAHGIGSPSRGKPNIGIHNIGSEIVWSHHIGCHSSGGPNIQLRDSKRDTSTRLFDHRRAGMAVAGIVGEAVKGAVREARTAQGVAPVQRAVIFFSLLGIIVRTVWGNVTLVRYGVYAYWLHATLKPWEEKTSRKGKGNGNGYGYGYGNGNENVVVAKNVRYGSAERNLLDVYVPCKPKLKGEELKPVVIFVHGGVWASGDKWQFSPLGTFLAEEGVIVVLVQYTLFPEALAIEQVGEVSESLTWTMDNIAQYGGDPNRVFLMGHSSGAHLCAMVLWERASRRIEKTLNSKPSPHLDVRIPRGFLGLAGVYNIGEHFKYEVGRGVGAISCMRPANGWEPQFDAMSPSLLFESLLLQKGVKFLHTNVKTDGKTDGETEREADSSIATVLSFKGLDLVPRCLMIASIRDITVPPTSSVAFNAMLQTLGCETRVVMHDEMAHEDFALWHQGWGSLKTHIGPFIEEVLRFVSIVEES